MDRKRLAILLLTVGLVLVFGWFGIDKFRNPLLWIGFLPTWMDGLFGLTKEIWLSIVGASEVIMAILLLIPIRTVRQTGATLMALHLMGILTQVGWNDIGVRDIGLLASSLALLALL